ncbi:MAG: VWA domain-containing protein [Polyangiaceae bacterium]|nr:VWA domain-containing protein [Polyangiaceae bacterium]
MAARLPWVALAVGLVAWAAYLLWAIRVARLGRRPVLLALSVVGALPLAYVGFTWTRLVPETYLRLARPALAAPCALALVLIAHRLLGLSSRQGASRRMLTEAFIAASALAAALAIIGVELGRPIDRVALLVAIDRSRSIDLVPGADARIRAELQVAETGMRDDDLIGTIAFGADAAVEDPLRPRSALPAPQRVELGRDGTDLGAAIRRALAEVPSDASARIVLLSDGVSTRGDPLDAAASAVAAGVPVDVVPLDQAVVPDVRLVAVRMSPRANKGETLEMRIVTSSTRATPVEVRIYRDGTLIRRGDARLRAGEDVLSLRELAPEPGLHRYEVALTAQDPSADQAPEDNSGATFVRVRGEATALVMDHDPALGAAMVRALEAAAFRADAVGPSGVPADLAGFAAYDVVVLGDISAPELAPTQLAALASYVRDLGGGLLLMGGDRAMGPGGYGKTPIEEVSPVSFDIKQERRRASLAEVIVIDYSGSMAMSVGSQTKLELANEAAARSAKLLGAGDRLGVMHVDTAVKWTVPLGPVTDLEAIVKAIRAVGPGGGGIYVDLSLETAYAALARETVNLKHVLLFSDGSDAENHAGSFVLANTAKARGITTSVVALGQGSDVPDLERISKLGGGRFYLIEDASRLPAVFAQETILAARSSINEVTFKPTLTAISGPVRGIDFGEAPPLTGYVVTIPKGRAQVLLRGPEADPVLATWSVGIGRAAAFTSDYKDRWGVSWTGWSGATRLFGQLARDIARVADDPHVRLEADASGGELHVRATVVDDDGRTESFKRLKAHVGGPDGFSREVALEAVGAGAYAATVPLSRPGSYIVTAIDELGGEPLATTGAALTAGEELRPTGTDRALLGRIAAMTGGKLRDTLAGVFEERDALRFAYRSLDAWLLGLSAFALLFGVAARRVAVPEWLGGAGARLRARARRRDERRRERALHRQASAERTAQAMSALRGAKERSVTRVVDDAPPPSVPRFGQVRPPPVASRAPPPSASPTAPPAATRQHTSQASEGPPPERKQSAAEILLARRRGRRP